TVAWDSVEPASLRPAADALFDASSAEDQFERGRFFVARRMWKEAIEAFERAAKLGDGYESRVLEFKDVLARLSSGQGGFRGAARRAGSETILLTYDWQDTTQLEDWTPGLALAGASAVLESKTRAGIVLRGTVEPGASEAPVVFQGDLNVEMKLTSTAPVAFTFFLGPERGYEIELGPAGVVLYRFYPGASEKDRRREIAKSDKAKIVAGT